MNQPIEQLLEGPLPANVLKILDAAQENRWEHNFTSLVTRWAPHGEQKYGEPWFASWHLHWNEEKEKWSWRWAGGMAANLQRMNRNDTLLYLENPCVIYPEPPRETQSEMIYRLRERDGEGKG